MLSSDYPGQAMAASESYVHVTSSAALAQKVGIEPDQLISTIDRFNGFPAQA